MLLTTDGDIDLMDSQMVKYKYRAFGLIIDSELFFPELECGDGDADISIIVGSLSFDAEFKSSDSLINMMPRDEFTFCIEHVAKYSIQKGNCIIVEPFNGADLRTLRDFLLGMGMGVLLIQRGLIPIHGSAVAVNGKATIITGNSGAGKTTLCSWFQKNGYRYLADDISVIKLDNCHVPMVQPAFPQQKVCMDVAAKLELNVGELPIPSLHDNKYILINKNCFVRWQVPLHGIVEIAGAEIDRPVIRKITGIDKINYFMKNIFCTSFYQEIGFGKELFECCIQIIKQIEIYQLLRPKGKFSAEEQMRLIIDTISD